MAQYRCCCASLRRCLLVCGRQAAKDPGVAVCGGLSRIGWDGIEAAGGVEYDACLLRGGLTITAEIPAALLPPI
jgi:hypothetical protein